MRKFTRRETIGAFLLGMTRVRDLRGATPAASTQPTSKPYGGGPMTRPVVARWTQRRLPTDEVNLIAMGDWGAGDKQQKSVANGLSAYLSRVGTQFNGMLSTGDNFYVSPKNENDPLLQAVFEDTFDAKYVNFPVYAALGNHDYEKDKDKIEMAYAAQHPDSRWKLPSRWYRVDLPADRPIVTALMLDSNKPKLSVEEWFAQMKWIDEQLASAKAAGRWTVACAHHPLFSNGAHGDNGVLQVHWGPIFKKHKLDFYACGHDHDLQQLTIPDWSTSFLLAGGGGKKPTKMRRDLRGPFSRSINGFAHLNFTHDQAIVRYVNTADDKVVHQVRRARNGSVEVTIKGGNDKATNQPLRVLLGLDEDDKKTGGDKEHPDKELDP